MDKIICPKCKQKRDFPKDFNKDRRRPNGYSWACRKCLNKYNKNHNKRFTGLKRYKPVKGETLLTAAEQMIFNCIENFFEMYGAFPTVNALSGHFKMKHDEILKISKSLQEKKWMVPKRKPKMRNPKNTWMCDTNGCKNRVAVKNEICDECMKDFQARIAIAEEASDICKKHIDKQCWERRDIVRIWNESYSELENNLENNVEKTES